MIVLLPVKVPMTTKEQITLSRSGERAKTSGHFYGRLRAVQGIRGLSYTGGYGRFRGEWVKATVSYLYFSNIKNVLVPRTSHIKGLHVRTKFLPIQD